MPKAFQNFLYLLMQITDLLVYSVRALEGGQCGTAFGLVRSGVSLVLAFLREFSVNGFAVFCLSFWPIVLYYIVVLMWCMFQWGWRYVCDCAIAAVWRAREWFVKQVLELINVGLNVMGLNCRWLEFVSIYFGPIGTTQTAFISIYSSKNLRVKQIIDNCEQSRSRHSSEITTNCMLSADTCDANTVVQNRKTWSGLVLAGWKSVWSFGRVWQYGVTVVGTKVGEALQGISMDYGPIDLSYNIDLVPFFSTNPIATTDLYWKDIANGIQTTTAGLLMDSDPPERRLPLINQNVETTVKNFRKQFSIELPLDCSDMYFGNKKKQIHRLNSSKGIKQIIDDCEQSRSRHSSEITANCMLSADTCDANTVVQNRKTWSELVLAGWKSVWSGSSFGRVWQYGVTVVGTKVGEALQGISMDYGPIDLSYNIDLVPFFSTSPIGHEIGKTYLYWKDIAYEQPTTATSMLMDSDKLEQKLTLITRTYEATVKNIRKKLYSLETSICISPSVAKNDYVENNNNNNRSTFNNLNPHMMLNTILPNFKKKKNVEQISSHQKAYPTVKDCDAPITEKNGSSNERFDKTNDYEQTNNVMREWQQVAITVAASIRMMRELRGKFAVECFLPSEIYEGLTASYMAGFKF